MQACQIQKIYTTQLFICLAIRTPGKTTWWWLGRHKPYCGIWKLESAPEAKYRGTDVVTEWLRARLKGSWIEEPVLKNDQLVIVDAKLKRKFYLGYLDGILNFVDASEKDGVWHYQDSKDYSLQQDHNILRGQFFDQLDAREMLRPDELLSNWYLKNQKQIIKKQEKKINRKIERIKTDLLKLNSHHDLYEIAGEPNKLLEYEKLEMNGVKIKFEKSENAFKRADKVFNKAKRLKQALSLQEKRLYEEIQRLNLKNNKEQFDIKPQSLGWKLSNAKNHFKKKIDIADAAAQDVVYIKLSSGTKIAIGLNAKANDYLRKVWANKDDIWVHIENVTGAHLFYKNTQIPTGSEWELIGSMLRDYSGIQALQVNLVWTRVRNLKAVKGFAGLVRFTKEKRIMVNYLGGWRNLLSLR